MPAQIFVSCGQASERERFAAAEVRATLESLGFDVYIAIEAQSIEDVNSGIIRQLERSDYYLFIDFRREVFSGSTPTAARGSLFTNQELAIAYVFGFEHVLFFQEKGVQLEGLLRYLGANPTLFDSSEELVARVRDSVDKRWNASYSRHLVAARPSWSEKIISIPTRGLRGRFLFVDIENRRPYTAAFDTVARLEFISSNGAERYVCGNRSHLKTTGQPGFSQVIWPASHGAFDALMVDDQHPDRVYLHNALDVAPQPIIVGMGRHILDYAVLARDFPVLRFSVDLNLSGDLWTTTASLIVTEPNQPSGRLTPPLIGNALGVSMNTAGQTDWVVPRLILLGGLPGSGKTTHMDQLAKDGWVLYDDFQANAYDNSPRFPKARRYAELIQDLRRGHKCVVADIRFVCADYRTEAQRVLQEDVGELSLEWRLFANDPLQCTQNIQFAVGSRQAAPRLVALKEFSRKYSLPSGVVPMPVCGSHRDNETRREKGTTLIRRGTQRRRAEFEASGEQHAS